MSFPHKLKLYQQSVEEYLNKIVFSNCKYTENIIDSMRYSLFAGGKRLRPVLMLAVGEIFDCPQEDIMPFAASMEMIHTYSLIHDDLPAMDNDSYRRGKLTNHMVYGEGMAILAGDGLLNLAYEHMLETAGKKRDFKYVLAGYEIARSSGVFGMIGGQAVDISSQNKNIDWEIMEYMYDNKTGALISASVRAGAIISGASEEDLQRLTHYSRNLGRAFQIIDDILDVTGYEKKLGKSTGSDLKNNKATYVSMAGIERAKSDARELSNTALQYISYYGEKASFLKDLTLYLLNREY